MNPSTGHEGPSRPLSRLLGDEVWDEYFARCRSRGPEGLVAEAGRFRDALRGAGTDCSVDEVRRALFQQAGFDDAARSVGIPEAARGSDAEPADGRHAEDVSPRCNVVRFPVAKDPDGEDAGSGRTDTGNPRAASRALHRLYAEGVRLEIREGELYAGRSGGLENEHRALLREHKEGLKSLLSEEAMAEVWSPALRHIASALGDELEGVRYERAVELYDEAQEAYQDGDNGLCRYLLQRAALAARKRPSEQREQETKEAAW